VTRATILSTSPGVRNLTSPIARLLNGHGLHLQLGADFETRPDDKDRVADRAADHRGAVAAHQERSARADQLCQIAAPSPCR